MNYSETLTTVKREAKRLRKRDGIALSKAQEQLARESGFQNLHELTALANKQSEQAKSRRPTDVVTVRSREVAQTKMVGASGADFFKQIREFLGARDFSPLQNRPEACPFCASGNLVVEEIDSESFEELTEGQQADYLAGFGWWSHCQDCGANVDHD